jgi:predicted  nucleic acid-binding Zn-ribbon protein
MIQSQLDKIGDDVKELRKEMRLFVEKIDGRCDKHIPQIQAMEVTIKNLDQRIDDVKGEIDDQQKRRLAWWSIAITVLVAIGVAILEIVTR